MTEAIEAMKLASGALSAGEAQAPQRMAVDLSDERIALLMPSPLQTTRGPAFGLKVVTVMPQNRLRGLPTVSASVVLLDGATGMTLGVVEGEWLTAMRTGAASGLATSLLARENADVLALFGAGAQAPMQALAIHAVRPLREARVVNRNDEHYRKPVASLQDLLGRSCTLAELAGPPPSSRPLISPS